MHRGILLLAGLALAVAAPVAIGDEAPARSAGSASSAVHRSAGPVFPSAGSARAPLDPMPGRAHRQAAAPAAYVAQAGIPGEPLGFSATRFNPNPGPIVDPSASSAVTYGPEFEDFDLSDPEAPPPTASSGEWLRNGCWYVDISAQYLQRSANIKNDVQLAIDLANPTNPFGVSLDLGFEPGLVATLGRYLGRDIENRDHSIEFTFSGLTHWGYAESISSPQGLLFLAFDRGSNTPVYDESEFQGFSQTSDLNNYEVNYRVDWRLGRDRLVYSRDSRWVREANSDWTCSVLAGIRTTIVNERLDWFAANELGTGSYFVTTHNNLVGPQVGAELFYDRAYWRAGIRTRAGGLVNFASQSTTVRILDDNGGQLVPNRDEYAENHSMSFVGGLSFMGEYRFKPNFGLKASFDLLWVTDLALAQNQLTFFPSDPAELSDSHALFFQGFTLGLEWFR